MDSDFHRAEINLSSPDLARITRTIDAHIQPLFANDDFWYSLTQCALRHRDEVSEEAFTWLYRRLIKCRLEARFKRRKILRAYTKDKLDNSD